MHGLQLLHYHWVAAVECALVSGCRARRHADMAFFDEATCTHDCLDVTGCHRGRIAYVDAVHAVIRMRLGVRVIVLDLVVGLLVAIAGCSYVAWCYHIAQLLTQSLSLPFARNAPLFLQHTSYWSRHTLLGQVLTWQLKNANERSCSAIHILRDECASVRFELGLAAIEP